MDNVLELSQLWDIIRKRFLLIVALVIVFAGVAFGIAQFAIAPKYSSSTQLLVNRKQDANNTGAQFNNQQADVQIINTYKDLITNPVILDDVVDNLTKDQRVLVKKAQPAQYETQPDGTRIRTRRAQSAEYKTEKAQYANLTADEVKQMISVTNQQNSQVFAVNVKSTNAKKSAAIANEIASVFKDKVVKLMSISNVTIVSEAQANKEPVSPNKKLITLAGAVLGAVVAFGYGLVRELTDKTLKNIDYLTEDLDLTDLGVINYIGKVKTAKELAASHQAYNDDENGDTSKRSRRRV